MKFSATFKTPNAIVDGLCYSREFKDEEEQDSASWMALEKTKKWVEWGEVITIDFDTEAGTATIREVG